MQFIEYCAKSKNQNGYASSVLYLVIIWLHGSCGSLSLPRIPRDDYTACYQPGKRAKFNVQAQFLLNGHPFPTIVKSKNHKWNQCKLGIVVLWFRIIFPKAFTVGRFHPQLILITYHSAVLIFVHLFIQKIPTAFLQHVMLMGALREGRSDGNRCWALPLWGLPSFGLSNSVNIFETLKIIMSKK